jgi:NADPH-dependent glutamate synthase beta subunit-like oxidoreductase
MSEPTHFVAIIGGAVAGSEAAEKLAQKGVQVVVFEQNALPYGKIETGLPKWHAKLRDSQERKIDEKLNHPLVRFVPNTRLGSEITLKQLRDEWGFSAILLATGAWRDRGLPVDGIDAYVGRGLYYQNPFVAWFNQNHDPDYSGPDFTVHDDALVIGGGLASFDVVKIVMIETTRAALAKRGITIDTLSLEKNGIPETLGRFDLRFEDLGLKGSTLVYRRKITDMPLTSLPEDPTPRDLETAARVRQKIFDNVQKKFLFRYLECYAPAEPIVKEGRLNGLTFKKTQIVEGRLRVLEDQQINLESPLVISAIGSLPEPLDEIPMDGDVYRVRDLDSGELEGLEDVFALGNAVTGRGNLKESQLHGRRVTQKVVDEFLAWNSEDYQMIFDRAEENADEKVFAVQRHLRKKPLLDAGQIGRIGERIRKMQQAVGFSDYHSWIRAHLPPRLENMIETQ